MAWLSFVRNLHGRSDQQLGGATRECAVVEGQQDFAFRAGGMMKRAGEESMPCSAASSAVSTCRRSSTVMPGRLGKCFRHASTLRGIGEERFSG